MIPVRNLVSIVIPALDEESSLPHEALRSIRHAVGKGVDAGAFRLRYDRREVSFRLAGWLSDLHCRRSGDLFGDRAMFVRSSVFKEPGGFRPLPLLDDLDLAARLRARGSVIRILDATVISSSRRFRSSGIWHGGLRAGRLVRDFDARRPLDRCAVEFYTSQER